MKTRRTLTGTLLALLLLALMVGPGRAQAPLAGRMSLARSPDAV